MATRVNGMSDERAESQGVRDAREGVDAKFAKQQAALEAKKARRGAQKAAKGRVNKKRALKKNSSKLTSCECAHKSLQRWWGCRPRH